MKLILHCSWRRRLKSLYLTCPILTFLLFALDVAAPQGIVISSFYGAVIVAALPTWDRRFLLRLSLGTALLILLGEILKQDRGLLTWAGFVNATAGVLIVGAVLHSCCELMLLRDVRSRQRAHALSSRAQTREAKGSPLTMCAWTKRMKEGETWVSIEEFLERHFNLHISHGISDQARQELLAQRPRGSISLPAVTRSFGDAAFNIGVPLAAAVLMAAESSELTPSHWGINE